MSEKTVVAPGRAKIGRPNPPVSRYLISVIWGGLDWPSNVINSMIKMLRL